MYVRRKYNCKHKAGVFTCWPLNHTWINLQQKKNVPKTWLVCAWRCISRKKQLMPLLICAWSVGLSSKRISHKKTNYAFARLRLKGISRKKTIFGSFMKRLFAPEAHYALGWVIKPSSLHSPLNSQGFEKMSQPIWNLNLK